MAAHRRQSVYSRQLKELSEYVSDKEEYEFNYVRGVSRLERELNNPDADNIWRRIGSVGLDLEWLARWIGAGGAVMAAHGDLVGWKEIHRAFLYHCWSVRSRHAIVDKLQVWDEKHNPNCSGSFDVGTEVHLFLESIALQQDDFAHGMGRQLVDYVKRTGGGDRILFYYESLKLFAFKLYCKWIGEDAAL